MSVRRFMLVAGFLVATTHLPLRTSPAQEPLDERASSGVLETDEGGEEEGEEDEIATDRDSFTPATSVVGRRRTVIESAWSFLDNRSVAETHSFPEALVRYGVNDWLELRLGWSYEVGGGPNSISGAIDDDRVAESHNLERESQLSYGAKFQLTEQDGWLPQSALITQAGTPTSGLDTATQFFTTYAFGWRLPNRWVWDTSLRYGIDSSEGDHFNVWAPSTVLKVPVGERWNIHAEYFGVLPSGGERDSKRHYFSPGAHYLITPNVELGARFGWGLNEDASRFFVNVGGGVRF